jgi:hypothetical protein
METQDLGPGLRAACARVPDVRSRHGRRYALPALLTLAAAAMLAGARSLYAIVQWGRRQPPEVRAALGLPGGRLPTVPTLHYAYKRLDVEAFEAALTEWAAAALGAADAQLVLDGKALRGIHGEELPGVRLVALYAPEAGLVLAQSGGQDRGGAGADGGGARGGQGGGGTGRGAAGAGAGGRGVARAAGERRRAVLPEGAMPPTA